MVVVDADLALGADPQALEQADPNVATGLETGQVVFAIFVVFQGGQRHVCWYGGSGSGTLGAEHEVFVQLRVAEAGQQRSGNARDVTEPIAAVADFGRLQIGRKLDAVRATHVR